MSVNIEWVLNILAKYAKQIMSFQTQYPSNISVEESMINISTEVVCKDI